MMQELHILVITENENSDIVRTLLRHRAIPITRRSIQSAIDLLQHTNIIAIVIDREHKSIDSLEFILNVRDITEGIPIYIPDEFSRKEDWSIINNLENIVVYEDKKQILNVRSA